jgi:hypothetical protein
MMQDIGGRYNAPTGPQSPVGDEYTGQRHFATTQTLTFATTSVASFTSTV